jgi:thymidylate synthase ThyX
MITAKIIKDSINAETGDRLTTFLLKYPRFFHSDVMTHRALSRNASSSRAIPSATFIKKIRENPAMPEFWGANKAGMQAAEEVSPSNKVAAKEEWLKARDLMIESAEKLSKEYGLHKQIANRILEPWQHMEVIMSATEWENMFALRSHKDAQPEFEILAGKILEELNKGIPEIAEPSYVFPMIDDLDSINKVYWHLPFEDRMPDGLNPLEKLKISIARCARISYTTQEGTIDPDKDFELCDRLIQSSHMSPAEHVAYPYIESKFFGNFKGWVQFRKMIKGENKKDSRLAKYTKKDGKWTK